MEREARKPFPAEATGDEWPFVAPYLTFLYLFDPKQVIDRATFADPIQLPNGVAWVFVNGAPVLHDRIPTGLLPGSLLRMANTAAGPYVRS